MLHLRLIPNADCFSIFTNESIPCISEQFRSLPRVGNECFGGLGHHLLPHLSTVTCNLCPCCSFNLSNLKTLQDTALVIWCSEMVQVMSRNCSSNTRHLPEDLDLSHRGALSHVARTVRIFSVKHPEVVLWTDSLDSCQNLRPRRWTFLGVQGNPLCTHAESQDFRMSPRRRSAGLLVLTFMPQTPCAPGGRLPPLLAV